MIRVGQCLQEIGCALTYEILGGRAEGWREYQRGQTSERKLRSSSKVAQAQHSGLFLFGHLSRRTWPVGHRFGPSSPRSGRLKPESGQHCRAWSSLATDWPSRLVEVAAEALSGLGRGCPGEIGACSRLPPSFLGISASIDALESPITAENNLPERRDATSGVTQVGLCHIHTHFARRPTAFGQCGGRLAATFLRHRPMLNDVGQRSAKRCPALPGTVYSPGRSLVWPRSLERFPEEVLSHCSSKLGMDLARFALGDFQDVWESKAQLGSLICSLPPVSPPSYWSKPCPSQTKPPKQVGTAPQMEDAA